MNKILNYFDSLDCQPDEVIESEVLEFIQTNCDKDDIAEFANFMTFYENKNDIVEFANFMTMLNENSDTVSKIISLM